MGHGRPPPPAPRRSGRWEQAPPAGASAIPRPEERPLGRPPNPSGWAWSNPGQQREQGYSANRTVNHTAECWTGLKGGASRAAGHAVAAATGSRATLRWGGCQRRPRRCTPHGEGHAGTRAGKYMLLWRGVRPGQGNEMAGSWWAGCCQLFAQRTRLYFLLPAVHAMAGRRRGAGRAALHTRPPPRRRPGGNGGTRHGELPPPNRCSCCCPAAAGGQNGHHQEQQATTVLLLHLLMVWAQYWVSHNNNGPGTGRRTTMVAITSHHHIIILISLPPSPPLVISAASLPPSVPPNIIPLPLVSNIFHITFISSFTTITTITSSSSIFLYSSLHYTI